MQDFIEQYLPTIAYILAIIVGVINMVYTRATGKSIDKEVTDLKYRLPTYRSDLSLDEKYSEGQTFDPLVKQWKLDKHSDELLEKEDKLDVQQLINSAVETALDRTLARLMPFVDEESEDVKERLSDTIDDLDIMTEAFDLAEDYREKLGLSAEMSVVDIYNHVDELRKSLQSKLDSVNTVKQEVQENGTTEKKSDKPSEE